MTKKLLLIGGGHAHMVTLAKLGEFIERGYEVTVIQPSDYHYYSGMGPGMLGGTYHPDDIRFATRKVVEAAGAVFVQGKAERIDPVAQHVFLEGNDVPLSYDVLSCNAGSFVSRSSVTTDSGAVYTAKPIEALLAAKNSIIERAKKKEVHVGVVGGGPSAVEIAGNVAQLGRQECDGKVKVFLFGGSRVMSRQLSRIGKLVKKSLASRGVEIIEGMYVREIGDGKVCMENGDVYQMDVIFPCVGVTPSLIFRNSGLATGPDGGLRVNKYLQHVDYPNIFGGGDCIWFEPEPLDKVGVYAVRENPVLFHNLMASLEGEEMQEFHPGGSYLLIYNVGDGEGVFSKYGITFGGKLAFIIKNYIDQKFIATFQAIEE